MDEAAHEVLAMGVAGLEVDDEDGADASGRGERERERLIVFRARRGGFRIMVPAMLSCFRLVVAIGPSRTPSAK